MTPNLVVVLLVTAALLFVIILLLIALLRRQEKISSKFPASQEVNKYLLIEPESGVYNKNFFQKKLEEEIYRAHRYGSQFSLAILNFESSCKDVQEDSLPSILRKLGVSISKDTRFTDVVARTNKYQLMLLFPMTAKQTSEIPLKRLELKIKEILQAENLPPQVQVKLLGFPENKSEIEKLSRTLKEE